MRLISFLVGFAFFSSVSFAQQVPGTVPPGPPPTPYSTGALPEVLSSTGQSIEGPNNTTVIVKAVPCTVAARWTDGTTTCIGIPDNFRKNQR